MDETAPLDRPVTEDDVERLFQLIVKRPTGNTEYKQKIAASGISVAAYIERLRSSPELRKSIVAHANLHGVHGKQQPFSGYQYRAPTGFAVTPAPVNKILLIGSCLLDWLAQSLAHIAPDCKYDVYLVARELPELPASPIEDYQFQLLQITLRSILPDMAFAKLRYDDMEGHAALFKHCCHALERQAAAALRWNHEFGLLTFVVSFPLPQQNLVGRLLPRYDLRNPVYFIERLNEHFANVISDYQNIYFVDFNEVSASYGRKFSHEDNVSIFNHGALITDFNFHLDQGRLEPAIPIHALYEMDNTTIRVALWHEIFAMYRSLQQTDSIKMVVIDLDDTLWRGVIADAEPDKFPPQTGWPVAFWEALLILKKRGVILSIISKNEEQVVRNAWRKIVGNALSLDDFAVAQINWLPKSENMRVILKAVNLLPKNVIYIDDNPLQRAEIQEAFPDIRILGGQPVAWRHYLLTSPELQTATISTESARRTEMIQGQVQREQARDTQTSDEFLQSLSITMSLFEIRDTAHPRFARALELINKTNQFNTTGRRWRMEEALQGFQNGLTFHAFELTDKYTEYGLVGVLITDHTGISQFVMSCRIMGLDAEIAAVTHIAQQAQSRGQTSLFAAMTHTEKNLPCRDVYARAGFTEAPNGWHRDLTTPVNHPNHITLTTEAMLEGAAE